MLVDSPHQKIIDIIEKIDKTMAKQGYNQYQERFHRINKALNSIQQHSDCYVSNFSVDPSSEEDNEKNDENQMDIDDESTKLHSLNVVSPMKLNMDELLQYLETQLDLTEKCLAEETPITNTGISLKMNAGTPIAKNNKGDLFNKDNQQQIKKFLKIELRLRTYLEEHEWIKKSMSSKKKPRTALNKQSTLLPFLMKNFFDEKETVAKMVTEMNKRKSVFHNQICRKDINKISPKIISMSEKHEFRPRVDLGKSVSCFSIDDNKNNQGNVEMEGQEDSSSQIGSFFHQIKRNSLFKDKNFLKKQDTLVEKSDDDDSEDQ